jgi:hypothetical protein
MNHAPHAVPAVLDTHDAAETPWRAQAGRAWVAAMLAALGLVMLCGGAVYVLLGRPPIIGIDDANITQIYARNIAAGYGFVYTPGFERVEGSTSLLWTLLYAACQFVPMRPEHAAFVLGVGLSVAALAMQLDVLWQHRQGAMLFHVPAAIWLAAVPAYYAWTLFSLMDEALWAFALSGIVSSAAILAADNRPATPARLRVPCFAVIAALTRPESLAIVPAVITLSVFAAGGCRFTRATVMRYLPGAVAFAAAIGAVLLFRLLYFGYALPNTYYAKISSSPWDNILSGAGYVAAFVSHDAFIALGMISCIWAVGRPFGTRAEQRHAASTARDQVVAFVSGAMVLAAAAAQVVEGGDHFRGFRLLIVYTPGVR